MKVLVIAKQIEPGQVALSRVVGPFPDQDAIDDWLERRFGHEPTTTILFNIYELEEPEWEPAI